MYLSCPDVQTPHKKMDINQRLLILDDAIAAITLLIASEKTKRDNTGDVAEKAVITIWSIIMSAQVILKHCL